MRIESAVVGIGEETGDAVAEKRGEAFVIFLIDELTEIRSAFRFFESGESPGDFEDLQFSFRIRFQSELFQGRISGFDASGGIARRIIEPVVDPQLQMKFACGLNEPSGEREPEFGKISFGIESERGFIEQHDPAVTEILHPPHSVENRIFRVVGGIGGVQKIKRHRTELIELGFVFHFSSLMFKFSRIYF